MDGEIGGSHVCLLSAQTLGENSQSQIGILNTFINFCKKLKEAKKKVEVVWQENSVDEIFMAGIFNGLVEVVALSTSVST